MKSPAIVAALAALVASCAAAEPCHTFNPAAFSEAEQAALGRAVARWNQVTIRPLCLTSTDDGPSEGQIFKMEYGGPFWRWASERSGGGNILGVHLPGSNQIGIVENLSIGLFELTALHEFGHAQGLRHVGAPAIMHAVIGTASDLTANDIAECVRVGACAAQEGVLDGGE